MSTFDETRARRYLLGQTSEAETTALEDEYFGSPETLERVWAVENDLVDAFVAGELEGVDRAAFETHYLASRVHRDRVATAGMLRAAMPGAAAPAPTRRRGPAWAVGLALAAGLILVLAALAMRERRPPTGSTARLEATPVAATAATPVAAPTDPSSGPATVDEPASAPKATVAAFALAPMLLRGGQATPIVRVPAGTDELAITLEGDRPEGVSAGARLPFAVSTVEGERVATGHVQARADGLGVARIAAGRVPPGDYILAVGSPRSADGPLRQYFFRVVRESRGGGDRKGGAEP